MRNDDEFNPAAVLDELRGMVASYSRNVVQNSLKESRCAMSNLNWLPEALHFTD